MRADSDLHVINISFEDMTMGRTKSKKKVAVPQKSKLKKDPGVPKLPDLKERVRQHGKQRVPPNTDPDSVMASEPTLSSLAAMAAADEAQPEDPSLSTQAGKTREQLRKYYLRTLHKVIDESDIVILVLDARDPEGCRSRLVEEEVRRREAEGKKLVFVLNKIDLIPKANAQQWLKHLRHSTPTLPFLSSTQHQRSNINSSTAPALIKLLKAYKPKAGSMTIGVVGYPNVGKSSLINTLKRSKVCAVAAQPGHTKDLQSIQLERGIRILDSPGVVFDDDDEASGGKGQKKGSILLRNVVKVENVEDPAEVVEEILHRTPVETVRKIYNLPEFSSTQEFLTMLSMTSGRLLKGGAPDVTSAARQVLQDWNHQKIPYFSEPPVLHPSLIPSTVSNPDGQSTIAPGAENVGQAQILSSFSKPFELEGLFTSADAGAFGGRDVAMADEDGDVFFDAPEGDGMDEDVPPDQPMSSPSNPRKRPHSPSQSRAATPTPDGSGNVTMSISSNAFALESKVPNYTTRQSKRQRRQKDIPEYGVGPDPSVLQQMERSNPLSRKNLKKDAKRARKAHRMAAKAQGGGMEIDEDTAVGVGFTFMA